MPDKDTKAFWEWWHAQVAEGATPLPSNAWKAGVAYGRAQAEAERQKATHA